jgi:hypothetical protein
MEKESQSARQQDTNKLKEGLWEFFAHDDDELPAVPREKTGRGFNHPGTARALCPRAYIWNFDNDEGYVLNVLSYLLTLPFSFLEKITSGRIEITADQFPNFLYDEPNSDYPSEEEGWNVEIGLLSSPLCLWVCHSISSSRSRSDLISKHKGLQMYFHGQWILVAFGEEKKVGGW